MFGGKLSSEYRTITLINYVISFFNISICVYNNMIFIAIDSIDGKALVSSAIINLLNCDHIFSLRSLSEERGEKRKKESAI